MLLQTLPSSIRFIILNVVFALILQEAILLISILPILMFKKLFHIRQFYLSIDEFCPTLSVSIIHIVIYIVLCLLSFIF